MKRELTGTVYILDEQQTLLIFHRKQGKWLPPGGHVAEGELPHECALREAYEETGLEVEFILQETVWVEHTHARSIPRPYMCLVEEIPAFGDMPAHQHIDFIYVARPAGGVLQPLLQEVEDARWFSAPEVWQLLEQGLLYPEVLAAINALLV